MATQKQMESLPDIAEQNVLESPIKVKWQKTSKSRSKWQERGPGIRLADRDTKDPQYEMMGVSVRACGRQKTNMVFKTVEEAVEAWQLLDAYCRGHYTWNNAMMTKKYCKVRQKIAEELKMRGIIPEEYDLE